MMRQARFDVPGVLHHVMARGMERRPIFIDDRESSSRLCGFFSSGTGQWIGLGSPGKMMQVKYIV